MKLSYITPLVFPSKRANRVQVIKMAAAFSSAVDFTLFISNIKGSMKDMLSSYNVPGSISVSEVGVPFGWPKSLWLAYRYARIIRIADNDTVWYIRDVLLAFWLTFFCKKFRNCFFFELHALTRFPSFIYGRIARYAKGIITTNEKKKQDLIKKYHIPDKKILVFGNGIDIQEMDALPTKDKARKQLNLPADAILIVYTGTDAEGYGTNILRIAEKNLPNNIRILIITGRVRNEALLYMAAADILIAPYTSVSEHFRLYMSPMKVKEYMAFRKSIIVSDLPSIRMFLPDDAAFFIPPGDSIAIKNMIHYISKNSEEATGKGVQARRIAEMFTWKKRADTIISFIKDTYEK